MGGSFSGQLVVITGAAAGIGAASARLFAASGAHTVLLDRDVHGCEKLVRQLTDGGASVEQHSVDVADVAAVQAIFADIMATHGRVDVLHANAGIEWTRSIRETDPEEWNAILGVNLTGIYACGREALRAMCERRSGAIVITASPHATRTVPDAGAYAASKGGSLALAKAMALEGAPYGVRVNAVLPGAIDTPMLRREAEIASDPDEQRARFAQMHPLNRLGRPEEVAAAVLFLAGDDASFVTGAGLYVDGGQDASLSSGPPLPYSR